MRRTVAVLVAATMVMAAGTSAACSGPAESRADRDADAAPRSEGSDTLPLAPDVDPCQLPPDVIGVLAGINAEPGTFTGTGDGAGECVYAEEGGDELVVTVDTSDGGDAFDDANRRTIGEDVGAVGDEAFWTDPTLHLVSDGHYWTFTVNKERSDVVRRKNVAIALAQALDL